MGEFLMRMQFRQGQVRSLKMPRRLLEANLMGERHWSARVAAKAASVS
jgi:hypothetical protein